MCKIHIVHVIPFRLRSKPAQTSPETGTKKKFSNAKDQVPKRNWNLDEALCLYHRMLWVCIKPDIYTFPCVLRSCGGAHDFVRGREIHCHVIRFGFETDVSAVNALITMYVKCSHVNSARLLFDKMPQRDIISWNAMISGYFENGE